MSTGTTSASALSIASELAGAATPDGTAAYAARFASTCAPDFFRPLDHRAVSSIGLGTYLGECEDAEDARYNDVTRHALRRGINLLDTAINYRCQRSERVLGHALRDAIQAGDVRRDEVVVCTKGGFVPLDGQPPATRKEYLAYLQSEFFDREIMTPADVIAGGHCLAPSFLRAQIVRSRANLGVRTIDVYYLHNPEQQLDGIPRERFRLTMRAAFEVMEEAVRAGDIATYGCATWHGLRVPPGAKGHLSLVELVNIAREVGGDDHHFRVVQCPINIAMAEGVRAPTQQLTRRDRVSVLQAAAELGIAVVASASLAQAQLTHGLPQALRDAFPTLTSDAQRALAFVRALPVASALVGMRQLAHLDENLKVASA